MKVEIINKDELINLYKNHGLFACTCYDTSDKFAEKVGKSCNEDGHMSGSRTEYIKFRVYDVDRGTAEQIMRHEIGTDYEWNTYSYQDRMEVMLDVNPNNIIKNMQSFRYVDKKGFTYTTPDVIKDIEDALMEYQQIMENIEKSRNKIKEILITHGINERTAIENANFVLPRATNLTLTIGFTPEALIHFMHKRLCKRAQDLIRKVAIEMKKQVKEILPEFATQLVPHCQHLLWCPESKKMTCGAYPNKEDLLRGLKEYRRNNDPK